MIREASQRIARVALSACLLPLSGKPKRATIPSPAGRLDVSACLHEGLGRVRDEFSVISAQLRRRAFLGEIVFVRDVANDRGHFTSSALGIEGAARRVARVRLFVREATSEKVRRATPRATGSAVFGRSQMAAANTESRRRRRDGQRLKRNLVERANPGNPEQLDEQDRERANTTSCSASS